MLAPGTRLGPYEIRGVLGVGGMGEVYRAADTRLQREVAIKVLPAELVRDPARRQRFTKEAQAASAFSHPHVVAVFDVDLNGETPYIVYELVEGVTLRHMVGQPMNPRRLLDLAVQIADGLAGAHQAGLMHRDLKPENVIVTREGGRAKILDFGLAKLDRQAIPSTTGGDSATQSIALTIEGNLIGTVYYMSPEQASGQPVDRRADLFAFGVMLYEMAAGKRPFDRKTAVETLSAVINDEAPPIDSGLPLPLRITIRRCLEKEPGNRYDSTRDLLADLKMQRELGAAIPLTTASLALPPAPVKAFPWKRTAAAAGLLAAGVLAGLLLAPRGGGAPGIPANHFRPLATASPFEDYAAWSPDGKTVAFHAAVDGRTQIFTRNADSSGLLRITYRNEACLRPQWSGDGRRIYFRSGRTVFAVGAAGGEPEPVLTEADSFAVSRDGKTMAILRRHADTGNGAFSVMLSSPPGSAPVRYQPAPFAGPDFNSESLTFSPDGRQLLFFLSIVAAERPAEFWLLPAPAGSSAPKRVLTGLTDVFPVSGVDWMPDGRHLVLAYTFRPDVLRTHISLADIGTGAVQPVLTGIGSESHPAVSPDGATLAYTAVENDVRIVEIPLDGGAVHDLVATARVEHWPSWSRKAREFAYITDRSGSDEIWVAEPDRNRERAVVTQAGFNSPGMPLIDSLAFAPDGERIAFSRAARIWIAPVSGGAPVRLTPFEATQLAPTWSPDGNWIAFYSRGKQEGLLKVRVGGSAEPVLIHGANRGQCLYCAPDWSPRGDWIAYYTPQGTMLIAPEPGGASRVLRNPPLRGTAWSHDGATLYGLAEGDGRQQVVAIDIANGRERVVNTLAGAAAIDHIWQPGRRMSLSPDGKALAATARRASGDIWTVRDFAPPLNWLARLGLR